MRPTTALIVLGGVIILATVLSAGIAYDRDKGRVAEFYLKPGNSSSPLPNPMMPEPIRPVEVMGFVAGSIMVGLGILRSRTAPIAPAV